jgi:hypothetical protein
MTGGVPGIRRRDVKKVYACHLHAGNVPFLACTEAKAWSIVDKLLIKFQ